MTAFTSRDRILAALDCQLADHAPCCFMSFTALRKRCDDDMYALARAERAMGLDAMLFIPTAPRRERLEHPELRGLPVRSHPGVTAEEWIESGADQTILHKRYLTPEGELTTQVRISDDWPHGDHIPFIDDYQVPRASKPLVTRREDLAPLRFLLTPPSDEDRARFAGEAAAARQFAAEEGVLLAGGWGVGVDMACWLCGINGVMTMQSDDPGLLSELLEMIHQWNMQRMAVVLDAGLDLFFKRAWYEGCDFVTPRFYRSEILPRLKAEVALAHSHGARFGYICSSGLAPMTDLYLESGIDALVGIDPVQGTHTDMRALKAKLGGRICLWGGVSGAVTVEMGDEQEVRTAVDRAFEELGPAGFVLSPIDNITVDAPLTWQNIEVLKQQWQTHWPDQDRPLSE